MAEDLFEQAAAKLRAGDPAAARALFARAAAAGNRRAAVVYTNFVAAGVGGEADWPRAVALLRELARSGRRSARELAIVEAMDLRADGSPAFVPAAEAVCERPGIVRFDGLFTPAECDYLVEAAAPMLAPAVVVDPRTGRQRPDPLRSSDSTGFTAPLENPAVHALNRRIAAASGTAPDQGEPLQVLRYRPGGEYRTHFDAIPGFANQRVMTMLVWLNADYEGGETWFETPRLALKGKAGDSILFRNAGPDGRRDPAAAHAGRPVRAGEKLIASRWIRARRFDMPVGERAG
jgi:prolyl 4-hydroxylase